VGWSACRVNYLPKSGLLLRKAAKVWSLDRKVRVQSCEIPPTLEISGPPVRKGKLQLPERQASSHFNGWAFGKTGLRNILIQRGMAGLPIRLFGFHGKRGSLRGSPPEMAKGRACGSCLRTLGLLLPREGLSWPVKAYEPEREMLCWLHLVETNDALSRSGDVGPCNASVPTAKPWQLACDDERRTRSKR